MILCLIQMMKDLGETILKIQDGKKVIVLQFIQDQSIPKQVF